ncbi:MAG: MotA/TolQ/ExbB proton channel family protein [Myxococcota bacterium]
MIEGLGTAAAQLWAWSTTTAIFVTTTTAMWTELAALWSEITSLWATLSMLFQKGGSMMWALCVVNFSATFLLTQNTLQLRQGEKICDRMTRSMSRAQPTPHDRPEAQIMALWWFAQRDTVLCRSLITSAPLIGLLGTVQGMVKMFSALAEGATFSASANLSQGIAQALLTTQMGLCTALPLLLWYHLLQRRKQRLLQALQPWSEETHPLQTKAASPPPQQHVKTPIPLEEDP